MVTTGPDNGGPRRPASRSLALAELVDGCMAEALARQGFAGADVIACWDEIVGEPLAAHSQPLRMDWPKRRGPRDPEARPQPATLVVRVTPAFALELQYASAQIVERVNARYGWACVGRIALRQGEVARPPARVSAPPTVDPEVAQRVATLVEPIADPGLADALSRFGRAVLRPGKG
ncbi:MAG: DUF721 domain-containing protein [Salinarimonadaceae bacterium]|nr:MAG: DUF721 domain-containing protein [Salinarimonadaceae bacterium]